MLETAERHAAPLPISVMMATAFSQCMTYYGQGWMTFPAGASLRDRTPHWGGYLGVLHAEP